MVNSSGRPVPPRSGVLHRNCSQLQATTAAITAAGRVQRPVHATLDTGPPRIDGKQVWWQVFDGERNGCRHCGHSEGVACRQRSRSDSTATRTSTAGWPTPWRRSPLEPPGSMPVPADSAPAPAIRRPSSRRRTCQSRNRDRDRPATDDGRGRRRGVSGLPQGRLHQRTTIRPAT